MGRTFSILATISAASLCAAAGAQQPEPYAQIIRDAGISPAEEGLKTYLLSLVPNEENQKHAEELVRQLGDRSFQAREDAEATLAALPNPPLELLRKATESDDPEQRYRATQVLAKINAGAARVVPDAVLHYIARHKIKNLAFPVLEYLPHSGETSAYGLALTALRATATEDDVELLRQAIHKKPPLRRAVAVLALADVRGKASVDELLPLVKHEDAEVRMAAAESLANFGRREALAPLVALLDDEDFQVRARSVNVLRSFTHQRFQFVAYDSEEARAPAVKQWRDWLDKSGKSDKLHFPLALVQPLLGRTLMSLYPNTLREIDAQENKLFEAAGFQYVWGCHATADGTRVVVDYAKRVLLEFDKTGRETLRLNDLPGQPSDVRRLEDGTFLVVLSDVEKVVELNREGKVGWSVELAGRPTTANRLENGNTLVNLQHAGRVVEVDRGGNIVWQMDGTSNALTAQALPNGNVLVCEMKQGQAIEYDRAGKVVWKKGGFHNACQAQRISNGNTLVSDANGLHEFDPAGDEVWSLKVPRGRFWRY